MTSRVPRPLFVSWPIRPLSRPPGAVSLLDPSLLEPVAIGRRLMEPTDIAGTEYFHRVVDCQWACPAHTDVPQYIRLIAQGRFDDAYLLNRESNVFPGILGRVCDRPCEPACRRGRVESEPVAICRLKRVAADNRGDIEDAPAACTRGSATANASRSSAPAAPR